MRDFEIAAIVLIAWVLLYPDSSSRAKSRHDVTSVKDGKKMAFTISGEISWEKIEFSDDNLGHKIYQQGRFERHEFVVKHSYDNEFTFIKRGNDFEIRDKHGNTCTIELDDYDHVKLTWRGESDKHYYRIG